MADTKKIHVFRFKATEIDRDEEDYKDSIKHFSGFVAAYSYSDAVLRLEQYTTPKDKDFEDCDLVSIDNLYEIDCDLGILNDDYDIEETYKYEKRNEQ